MKPALLILFASFCWGQTPAAVRQAISQVQTAIAAAGNATTAAQTALAAIPAADPLDAVIDAACPDLRALLAILLKGLVGLSVTNLVGDTTVPATPPLQAGSFFLYLRPAPVAPLPISTSVSQ